MSDHAARPPVWRQRLMPPSIAGLFAGSLLAVTWKTESLLAAQHLLIDLVMPVGLAWLASFYFIVHFGCRGQRRPALFAAFVFLAISVLFNPILVRELTQRIEVPPLAVWPLDAEAPSYRAVVVLGGGVSLASTGHPQLGADGDRVALAAQMWHEGKVKAIICTGEADFVPGPQPKTQAENDQRDRRNPARLGVDLLSSLGVPDDRLFRIGGANTSAEMKNLKLFLENPPRGFPKEGPLGLITSAFHIPRAMRLAKREGLELSPLPVAFRTGPRDPFTPSHLVPSVNAGAQFFMVARELLARLVGR